MIVGINANCRVLKTTGEQILYSGELTFPGIKVLIGAEIGEVCATHSGDVMIIDEEGKLKERPRNEFATRLYKYAYDKNGKEIDFIVGDVFIIPKRIYLEWENEDEEGDDEDLNS